MKNLAIQALFALALAFSCAAQPAATSMVGTVAGFGTGTPSIVVKADNGQSVAARLTPDTIAQRIVPRSEEHTSELQSPYRTLFRSVGTVAGFGTGTPSIVVKADNGQSVAARLTPDTIAQRIVPGEKRSEEHTSELQ